MGKRVRKPTRREFLELSVGAAGALLVSGVGCEDDDDAADGAGRGAAGDAAEGAAATGETPVAGSAGQSPAATGGGAGSSAGVSGATGAGGSGATGAGGSGGIDAGGISGQGAAGGAGQGAAGRSDGGIAGDAGVDADGTDASSSAGRRGYQIFSPGQLGRLRIKNRLFRAATWEGVAENGEVSDAYVAMQREIAEGGIGLNITGFLAPMEEDSQTNQIHVFDERHVRGLRRVSDAVHAVDPDSKIMAQIGHTGFARNPSSWSVDEIQEIVTAFAHAIRRLQEAGWDGVELHGAHGFLLSCFISPFTNDRTDQYGGSVENRVRMVREIVEQARPMVGGYFPIIIKLNSEEDVTGGIDIGSFPEVAREIEDAGFNAIDVSGSDCVQTGIDRIEEEAYFQAGADAIDVDIPVMVVGGNRTIDYMEELMQQSDVDFYGLSRPLIREPGLPNRWLEGTGNGTANCVSCNQCLIAIALGERVRCVRDEPT